MFKKTKSSSIYELDQIILPLITNSNVSYYLNYNLTFVFLLAIYLQSYSLNFINQRSTVLS